MSQRVPAGGAGYERSDPRIGPIIQFVFWLAFTCIATGFAVKWAFDVFQQQALAEFPANHPMTVADEAPPGPQLQVNPSADLIEFKAQQQVAADSYGWLEQTTGLVHIPVDRAIDLTLQRGLPARAD